MSISILDPSRLSLNILGCQVEGFFKGSFVSMEKEEQTFKTKTSIKGSKMAERKRNMDYRFTFRLDNTAGANTWLHALYVIQESYGVIFPVPLIYKDLNGTTSFFCPSVIIQEPKTEQGNEVYPTEWTLICPRAAHTIGGSNNDTKIANILSTISTFVQVSSFFDINVSGIQSMASQIQSRATSAWRNLF